VSISRHIGLTEEASSAARKSAGRLIMKSKPTQPLAISQPSSADGAGLALAFGQRKQGLRPSRGVHLVS
jgi:hypothetical protein